MHDQTGPGSGGASPETFIPISLCRIRRKFFVFAGLTVGCAMVEATVWLTLVLLLISVAILLAAGILGGTELIRSVLLMPPKRESRCKP
ncbi:hypothetical protein [Nonomuraea sp. KM90]|uniref:hypothetical protein n=1 Tax=Nonomuraea sp. KM90 TaxID=3457428 RepID=UPI003FCC445D